MTLIDETYLEEMEAAEGREVTITWAQDATEESTKRGRSLYAMLASLTTGRTLRIIQAVKLRND